MTSQFNRRCLVAMLLALVPSGVMLAQESRYAGHVYQPGIDVLDYDVHLVLPIPAASCAAT
jgi:hypothetical protein